MCFGHLNIDKIKWIDFIRHFMNDISQFKYTALGQTINIDRARRHLLSNWHWNKNHIADIAYSNNIYISDHCKWINHCYDYFPHGVVDILWFIMKWSCLLVYHKWGLHDCYKILEVIKILMRILNLIWEGSRS